MKRKLFYWFCQLQRIFNAPRTIVYDSAEGTRYYMVYKKPLFRKWEHEYRISKSNIATFKCFFRYQSALHYLKQKTLEPFYPLVSLNIARKCYF